MNMLKWRAKHTNSRLVETQQRSFDENKTVKTLQKFGRVKRDAAFMQRSIKREREMAERDGKARW